MRLAFVITVLLSAAVGLVSSDGAEPVIPPAQPKTFPMPAVTPPPAVAPSPYVVPQSGHFPQPVPPPHYQPPAYAPAPYVPHHDDVRAGVAVMVLKAKDKQELKKLFRSIVEEMGDDELQSFEE